MLTTILSKIGLPILIEFVAQALSKIDNPIAKTASEALGQIDEVLQSGLISEEQLIEANRHAETMAQMRVAEVEARLSQVNESLRAEIASTDKYVRRMRPTFGYIMATTWAAQMFGLAYVIVFMPDKAGNIMHGMSALSTIWGVGLSVLGIYVYKRSEDKKLVNVASDVLPIIAKALPHKKIQITKEGSKEIYFNE
jgi:ElaB/YqjD/DUF883 family membrane-anchored ribosome-binding protein